MSTKENWKTFAIIGLSVLVFIMVIKPALKSSGRSMYVIKPNFQEMNEAEFDVPVERGVSTSLLPREIPSQEDFGKFSPDEIMRGQNYLDPRAQIGYPGTVGGVLRNPTLDLRSEPPNPRIPVSIFNNSTISPDVMRPKFEIGA